MEHAVKGGYPHACGDKGFLRSVAGSFIAHLIVLAAALFIYKAPKKYLLPPVYTVSLIEPGSGGPRSTAPRLVEAKPAIGKTPAPPRKEAVKEAAPLLAKPSTNSVKTAQPKVKATAKDAVLLNAKLKKIKERVREKEESSLVESSVKRFKEKADRSAVERRVETLKKGLSEGQGTGLARGGEGHGTGGSEAGSGGGISKGNVESRYKAYYSSIRDNVQEAWIYPEGFENRKVTIIVSVRIAKSGKLLDSWVNESSGNPRFDESLMDAIKKASPFPPLPADFEGAYLETGFRFCHPPCE